MSTDAIVLLKDDHRQVRKLIRDFLEAGELRKDAPRSPAQPSALKKAVDAVIA